MLYSFFIHDTTVTYFTSRNMMSSVLLYYIIVLDLIVKLIYTGCSLHYNIFFKILLAWRIMIYYIVYVLKYGFVN